MEKNVEERWPIHQEALEDDCRRSCYSGNGGAALYAMATYGPIITGAVVGAASSAVAGFTSVAVNGGNLRQALKAAGKGALKVL